MLIGTFDPLSDLFDTAVPVGEERGDGLRGPSVVVGCLTDDDGVGESILCEHGVGAKQAMEDLLWSEVQMQLVPPRLTMAGSSEGVDEILEASASIARCAWSNGGNGHICIPECPGVPGVEVGEIEGGLGPDFRRAVVTGSALVEEIESCIRRSMAPGQLAHVLNELPVLLDLAGIEVRAEGTVGPHGTEGEGKSREAETSHVRQKICEVAAVGFDQSPTSRRYGAPMLSWDVGHVPDQDSEGVDPGFAHVHQLFVNRPGCSSSMIIPQDGLEISIAVGEGEMSVVRADERPTWRREKGGVVVGRRKVLRIRAVEETGHPVPIEEDQGDGQ